MPLATATASQRRSQRRLRAKARQTIHLLKKGLICLSVAQIQRLHHILSTHHSKDPSILAFLKSKMTDTMETWRCSTCMKICGKTHQFCGVCGKSWHLVADPTFVGTATRPTRRSNRNVQWNYTNWTPEDWDDHTWPASHENQDVWSKSPRRRQTPKRRTSRKKLKDPADDTALAKGKGKASGADGGALGPPSLAAMA